MNHNRCEADALRRLAAMPFLDRLELAALSGWPRGAVYQAVARLEREGMVQAIPSRLAPGSTHPPLRPHRRRSGPAGRTRRRIA